MLAFKLAFKNLIGAGLRTWLNVGVLSFAFVLILFYNGMLDGWNRQAKRDTSAWFTASGQLWHKDYDPYDTYCLVDAHAPLSDIISRKVQNGKLAPVLIAQGTAYPNGRMLNIILKGINPDQKIIKLPTALIGKKTDATPAIIGRRMAASAGLKKGDKLLIRWRDANGTFDAKEILIADVFSCDVPQVDNGQIWIPLSDLQEMTGLTNQATMLIAGENYNKESTDIWLFKDEAFLLKEIDEIIKAKKAGSSVLSLILLAIALLAIFDTQILSVFRRQKEIGTYIAMGMTRWRVVRIFTIEGSAHSLLAILLGTLYGLPLMMLVQRTGIPMPEVADATGVSISASIYPFYSAGMILSTILLVVISATIVSYFPSRHIAKLNPTEALKGKTS